MLDNTSSHPSKFRTKYWVEINDVLRGLCIANSKIKFGSIMLKSNLCDCCDPYILIKGTMRVKNTAATGENASNNDKQVAR